MSSSLSRNAESAAHSNACAQCGFSLWLPIAALDVSTLGLYNDARFPGRCILALNDHAEDFALIPEKLAFEFVLDARHAARAIAIAMKVPRVNYAILGNAEPHVHFHLIPRNPSDDPVPNRSPWNHPDPVRKLAPDLRDEIRSGIAAALEHLRNPNTRD
ncbi:MAG: diadenosine tetraphosphatase [Deltaproteobacteria bacterium]|nr:diadenosine tetraphosphatase [Deltaproteobacteria bacterium]